MAKLYIVPTPIGNLEDITLRALRVLKEVDVVLAEDTRTSSVLLRHYDIHTPLRAHHRNNEHKSVDGIVQELESGKEMALISDAGTPGISDPGFMLTRACREAGVEVETIPGPTAFVPALVNSGLPCERFTFEGFLPPKKGRASRLAELATEPRTMIIYESPLRLVRTLGDLCETFGEDRQASVSREISKLHDTTHRGSLGQLLDYFKLNNPRGECVIVVLGFKSERTEQKVHRNKFKKDVDAPEPI